MKSALQNKLTLQGLLIEVLENSFLCEYVQNVTERVAQTPQKKYRYFFLMQCTHDVIYVIIVWNPKLNT